jgi:hypothetical protein
MLPQVKEAGGTLNADECANVLRQMAQDMRAMFTHVEGLVRLLLVNPASSATSERSFSSLRRLKTYLRSTCSQQRLNHLAICHAHKDRLDEVNLNKLLAEFVAARDSRATIFGKIDLD